MCWKTKGSCQPAIHHGPKSTEYQSNSPTPYSLAKTSCPFFIFLNVPSTRKNLQIARKNKLIFW